jgi:hypothetical protein
MKKSFLKSYMRRLHTDHNATVTLTFLWLDKPGLFTVGDAAASFLDHTDETTKGICLYAKDDFDSGFWSQNPPKARKEWRPINRHWWAAPSTITWMTFLFLYATDVSLHMLFTYSSLAGGFALDVADTFSVNR